MGLHISSLLLRCLVTTFGLGMLISGVSGCGPTTNLFSLASPKSNKASFEASVSSGRAAYDSGEFDVALAHAERAIELNPDSEEAAVLYGYCQLSLAGIEPITLAQKMMGLGSSKTALAEDSSGDTLTKLSSVLGLTDDEIAKLGTLDVADPTLPIMVPKCAEETRTGLVTSIERVNKAIAALTYVVDKEVKVAGDIRHDARATTEYQRSMRGKAHFIWAFTHLTEALAFNKVIMFGTTATESTSNLQKRADKIKAQTITSPTEVAGFLNNLTSLQKTVDKIMPTTGECTPGPTTMLKALMNDMLAVNRAFGRMAGVPESMTASITKAMSKIEKLQSSVDTSANKAQADAMKAQLNTKLTKTVNDKLNELAASGQTLSPAQTDQACCAFLGIAGTPDALPDMCKANPPTAAGCAASGN